MDQGRRDRVEMNYLYINSWQTQSSFSAKFLHCRALFPFPRPHLSAATHTLYIQI